MKSAILRQRLANQPQTTEGMLRDIVVDELLRIDDQQIKIFRTFVRPMAGEKDEREFVLLTTSKETHLGFGQVASLSILRKFCYLLLFMFSEGDVAQILLYADESKKKAWLVTRTQVENTITFTCTPAH